MLTPGVGGWPVMMGTLAGVTDGASLPLGFCFSRSRLTIARIAAIHLISSSSDGAQRSYLRLAQTMRTRWSCPASFRLLWWRPAGDRERASGPDDPSSSSISSGSTENTSRMLDIGMNVSGRESWSQRDQSSTHHVALRVGDTSRCKVEPPLAPHFSCRLAALLHKVHSQHNLVGVGRAGVRCRCLLLVRLFRRPCRVRIREVGLVLVRANKLGGLIWWTER